MQNIAKSISHNAAVSMKEMFVTQQHYRALVNALRVRKVDVEWPAIKLLSRADAEVGVGGPDGELTIEETSPKFTLAEVREVWEVANPNTSLVDCRKCKEVLLFRIPRSEIRDIHNRHRDRAFQEALDSCQSD